MVTIVLRYSVCFICLIFDFFFAITDGSKFPEVGSTLSPLTSRRIQKFFSTQCNDDPLGYFLAMLSQLSLVISHCVFVWKGKMSLYDLWMWIKECTSSRPTLPVSTDTSPHLPGSANNRPLATTDTRPIDQPHPPKYEDLPPPSYESLHTFNEV